MTDYGPRSQSDTREWQLYAWADDAALFTAAEGVCPDSAKVQLNLGILARRRRDYPLVGWAVQVEFGLTRSLKAPGFNP